jgi:hypothetical protein
MGGVGDELLLAAIDAGYEFRWLLGESDFVAVDGHLLFVIVEKYS